MVSFWYGRTFFSKFTFKFFQQCYFGMVDIFFKSFMFSLTERTKKYVILGLSFSIDLGINTKINAP